MACTNMVQAIYLYCFVEPQQCYTAQTFLVAVLHTQQDFPDMMMHSKQMQFGW